MHTLILQDWTTIKGTGSGSGASIVQNATDWLDVTSYQDVVIWLQVAETSGSSVSIAFETAPTADEGLFTAVTAATTLNAAPAPVIISVFIMAATTPIARYLRWHLTCSSGSWDATFRVFVAANPPAQ